MPPLDKAKLENEIRLLTEILLFIEEYQKHDGWKLLKERYIDKIFKSLQNTLEDTNDLMRIQHTQGAIRNLKFLARLTEKIKSDRASLQRMLDRIEKKNAGSDTKS